MSAGLIALLDDIAAMAKLAAASVDDVSAAAAKASAKAAGVVIDDAAVTPKYVTGLTPERELPIIYKITMGSLKNKLLILLPACLLLSAFAPWALTPLLMVGGAYLCFEGAEKLLEKWLHNHHLDIEGVSDAQDDPAHIERETISGAIRTDFILSAEIMAIALTSVANKPIWEQGAVLVVVALFITIGVYGLVALIVKLDDIGLHLCKRDHPALAPIGRVLINAMPHVLAVLTVAGTAAMLWVGGGIILHGLEHFHLPFPAPQIEAVAHDFGSLAGMAAKPLEGVAHWLALTLGSIVLGFVVGSLLTFALAGISKIRRG